MATLSPRAAIAAVVLAVAALAVLLLTAAQQPASATPSVPSFSLAAGPPSQDCCGRGYP